LAWSSASLNLALDKRHVTLCDHSIDSLLDLTDQEHYPHFQQKTHSQTGEKLQQQYIIKFGAVPDN
jgi:hypothetical protein